MRSIVIIAVSICSLMATDPLIADMSKLPEPLQEEVNKTLVAQMAELAKAQEAIQKHRDRLIQSLERSRSRYERGRNADPAAVAAIDAMIESQKAAPSIVPVASEAVMKSLPLDPNQPESIFDGRTIEERKRDWEMEQRWKQVQITPAGGYMNGVWFGLNSGIDILDRSEFTGINIQPRIIDLGVSIRKLIEIGPTLESAEWVFQQIAPKSYAAGARSNRLVIKFQADGVAIDILLRDNPVNMMEVVDRRIREAKK